MNRSVAREDRPRPHRGMLRKHLQDIAPFVALGVYLILWLWLFVAEGALRGGPNAKTFEADFAMFYTASRMQAQHQNPYDRVRLFRAEQQYFGSQKLAIVDNAAVVRVGNPPLFFWMLRPLTNVPFRTAAIIWGAGLVALSALACLAVLAHAGWQRRLMPLVVLMLLPQTLLGAFYGNASPVVFTGMAAGLLLCRRFPFVAGIWLASAWIKPQVGLPVALLILLFHVPNRPRAALGFAAAGLLAGLATFGATTYDAIYQWKDGLFSYSREVASTPDLASLAGLYVRNVAGLPRTALEASLLLFACTVTAWTLARRTHGDIVSPAEIAWLWLVWFLATPYAHFFDEVLLIIPLLEILGPRHLDMHGSTSLWIVYLFALSLLLISWAPANIQLLSLPLLGILGLCLHAGRAGPPHRAVVMA